MLALGASDSGFESQCPDMKEGFSEEQGYVSAPTEDLPEQEVQEVTGVEPITELTLLQKDIQKEIIFSLEDGNVNIDEIFDRREVSNDPDLIKGIFSTPEAIEASKKAVIASIEEGKDIESEKNHIFKKYTPKEVFSDPKVENAAIIKVEEYIAKGDIYRAEKLRSLIEGMSSGE